MKVAVKFGGITCQLHCQLSCRAIFQDHIAGAIITAYIVFLSSIQQNSLMNKSDLINKFHGEFSQLRRIVRLWNLIPGAPDHEFDSLCQKIISHLYQGADINKVERVIKGELTVSYGFYVNEIDIDSMSHEVMNWWNSN